MNELDGGRLSIADRAAVRAAARRLVAPERRVLAAVIVLYMLAAGAGIAAPLLLGRIVDEVTGGADPTAIDRIGLALVGFIVLQMLLVRLARLTGHRFGERALARLREGFVDRTLALPMSTVERAGSGDLMTRASGDVATVGTMVRDAVPEIFTALMHAVVVLVAVFVLDPLLGLCALIGTPVLLLASRWYLRRARDAYLAEGAANSEMSERLAASADGARTIEAHRLRRSRVEAGDQSVAEAYRTRRRTLRLRTIFLPTVDLANLVPPVAVLAVGGWLYFEGRIGLGAVVSATLLLRQLVDPLFWMFMWLEMLQRGAASFARVEGVAAPDGESRSAMAVPADDRLEVRGVRYAYSGDRDVLHGVDLSVQPGERLAVVGPSGAGKTTLGRLLAGVDAPRIGRITLGGVAVTDLGAEELRSRVALVTQEHHVFIGSLRDNLVLAKADAVDAELREALAAVDADWALALSDGLDTEFGTGGFEVGAAQAQQLALARIVLADPHTLILDEATSLLDPATARHAERSLAAVLAGRTVIAIAHRLHTAYDADRVAVVDDGRITELGSHAELVAANGPYAALWRSWHG